MDTNTQLNDTYIKSIPHPRPGYSVVIGDMSGYIGRVIVTIESACIKKIESVGIRRSAWFDFDTKKYIKPRDNAIISVAKKLHDSRLSFTPGGITFQRALHSSTLLPSKC